MTSTTVAQNILENLLSLQDYEQARHLNRFFKTDKGQYGHGDKFLGIRVPVTRSIVKKYRHDITLPDIDFLTASSWHEVRLCGFLLLIELYQLKKKFGDPASDIIRFYLERLDRGNNWDLVDVIAPALLGDWLVHNPEKHVILDRLSACDRSLWQQRVAIVSTWTLIRHDIYEPTLRISRRYIDHQHDLIHKATGWMLREIGKRPKGYNLLLEHLEKYSKRMPRTMLRYSLERLSPELKKHFMRR